MKVLRADYRERGQSRLHRHTTDSPASTRSLNAVVDCPGASPERPSNECPGLPSGLPSLTLGPPRILDISSDDHLAIVLVDGLFGMRSGRPDRERRRLMLDFADEREIGRKGR